jgi:hypothetical protein
MDAQNSCIVVCGRDALFPTDASNGSVSFNARHIAHERYCSVRIFIQHGPDAVDEACFRIPAFLRWQFGIAAVSQASKNRARQLSNYCVDRNSFKVSDVTEFRCTQHRVFLKTKIARMFLHHHSWPDLIFFSFQLRVRHGHSGNVRHYCSMGCH